VLETYESLVSGDAPAAPSAPRFRDQVRWLDERDDSAATTWWSDRLADLDAATPLPLQPPAVEVPVSQTSAVRALSHSATADVNAFARTNRLTLNTLANGAWGLLLSHYSGSADVVFGSTVSGREHGVDGVEDIVGMLISTLPTRLRIDPSATVVDWLDAAQLDGLDARHHGHIGLADIQRLTDVPATQSLFDSIVVTENYPQMVVPRSSTLRPSELSVGSPSNFALAILVHPGEQLRFEAVYEESLLDGRAVERMLEHLEQTIVSMTAGDTQLVGDVRTITDRERSHVVELGRGAAGASAPRLVHEMIAGHAQATPDAVAVSSDGSSLTYADLDRRSNQLAHALRALGVVRGSAVGLVVGSSPQLIVGVQAIFKAGGIYVPLDPELPSARLAHMIDETELTVAITDGLVDASAIDVTDLIDLSTFGFDGHSSTAVSDGPTPDDTAYVIYTSGSTGTPKGVTITHANIAHSTAARFDFYPEPVETFLLLSSLAFDSSMVGLLWTLCSGGALVMAPAHERRNIRYLSAAIEEHGVTHLLALPSVYSLLLGESSPGQLGSLRTVIVAGEAAPPSLVAAHASHEIGASLYNEYGPTEATVWSHAHLVATDRDRSVVPIGRPIPNSTSVVLDHLGHPSPVGIPGELVLGGPGVSPGYLHRPDLTDKVFVTLDGIDVGTGGARHYRTGDLVRWRDDGSLDFVGRIDQQVKIRGYRIELTEVDDALADHADVVAAATVVAEPDGDGTRRHLVACYSVSAEVTDFDEVAYRAALTKQLPSYMQPATYLRVDEMPLTNTGKIDRNALAVRVADNVRRTPAMPTAELDGLEGVLQTIWADVLGHRHIGVDDDFFDLGGNSIDAMRLFARIEKATGRDLPLSSLFDAPTISGFAALLRTPELTVENSVLVPIKATGFKRPFYYVGPYEISVLELAKISRYFDPDRPFFGLQPSGLHAGEEIDQSVEAMASRYIDAIKQHQPRGPYLIGGHCDGCWIAHEMGVQLADRGEAVAYVGLVDLSPPPESMPATVNRPRRILDRIRYYRSDGRLWNAITWQLKLKYENHVLLRFGPPASRRVREVREAHAAAFGDYTISHDRRFPAHLIRSTELAVLMDEIPWYDDFESPDRVATVTDIRSTHARLLLEPETRELAATLAAGLDAAEGRS
jgi:amino acid adenylation domain-containing protein